MALKLLRFASTTIWVLTILSPSYAFTTIYRNKKFCSHNLALKAIKKNSSSGSGKGFGTPPNNRKNKGFANQTYGSITRPSYVDSNDTVQGDSNISLDAQAAMNNFFQSNPEWDPLFRSLISSPTAAALNVLPGASNSFGDTLLYTPQSPWRQLEPIPKDPNDIAIIGTFLDSMQQSLVEIPVNEETKEDASDLHFLEEGRRMLMISRFHVVSTASKNPSETHDLLFQTCWSELAELHRLNDENTGSMILLPDYKEDVAELQSFVEANMHRPLDWLGVTTPLTCNKFEVAAFDQGVTGIRILHQLSDIPKVESQKPMTMD